MRCLERFAPIADTGSLIGDGGRGRERRRMLDLNHRHFAFAVSEGASVCAGSPCATSSNGRLATGSAFIRLMMRFV